jgi:S1-C subfamily serine protease
MFHSARTESDRRSQALVRAQSPDRRPVVETAAQNPASFAGANSAPPSSAWPSVQSSAASFSNAEGNSLRETGREPRPTYFDSSTPTPQPSLDAQAAAILNASVRLRVEDAKGHAYGTGTIIDARQGEALVITCGHLFRENKGQGPVSVEMFEATPAGLRTVDKVPGQVISYDLERDVALVAIRPGREVTVARVAAPQTAIDRGDRVINVGCSNGQDPTALASRITSLNRYQGPPNIQASGAPVEGRSGGGLFNQKGELIGVCFAADHEGNEGLYAALKAIQDELAARGLSDVFMPAASNTALAATSATPASSPVVRGQEPTDSLGPVTSRPLASPNTAAATPVANNAPASSAAANLNQTEQAAIDEIMRRAATSEVICIIRPKSPGGQSEIITLGEVSADFVRALASRSGQSTKR